MTVVIILAAMGLAVGLRVWSRDRGDADTVSDAWLRARIRERRE